MAAEHKSLLTVVEDLTRVRSDISQLQATFKKVMETTPNWEQYMYLLNLINSKGQNSGETLVAIKKLKSVIFLPQTKVAVRLKQLYESGKLPVLTALTEINFKANAQEEAKQKQDILAFININPDDKSRAITNEEYTNPADWKSIEYYSYPPTLPLIIDQLLLLRVSTDKSYRQLVDYVESTSERYTNTHNAKLIIQGRAFLKYLLLKILDDEFPNLYEQDLNLILNRLMSSELLAKFAFAYNLVDPVKYNLSDDTNDGSTLEICGGIFAAYIAGLQVEHYKLDQIKIWVNRLYKPLVKDIFATSNPVAKVAIVEFQSLVKSITYFNQISYDNIQFDAVELKTDPFVAQIEVEGEVLGTGISSTSFEEARDRAAIDIMENKDNIIRLFTIVKHSYLRNRTSYVHGTLSPRVIEPGMDSGPNRTPVAYSYEQSQMIPPKTHSPHMVHPLPGQIPRDDPYPAASQQMTRYGQSPPPPPSQQQQYQQQQQSYQNQSRQQPPYLPRSLPPKAYQQPQVPKPNFSSQHDYGYTEPIPHIPLSHKDIDKQAKTTLHAILKARHSIDYEVSQCETEHKTIEFYTKCYVDGYVLGAGVDTNKKNSSQKAAMAALTNTTALRRLGLID
ncbi:hypothetical protein CORT_0G01120 [Candida orthopsilosis Co 90-125]|uniref:Uncharacterized protein n=1 Tax=Candida orthopsilosis (strain 90-125) TaxID=1136231 RepID=H8XAF1_CANO9|nr:hypothetical protein CORT_0G01120 [Candida orthopsilosis Co 90-125]CCG24800.1 hypothetical protein CORT_0G01120 [Candida orthopsilosis Co 90-125]